MGGGENEVIVNADLDAKGFENGTKRIEDAVKSLGETVEKVFSQIKEFVKNLDWKALSEGFKSGDWERVGDEIKKAVDAAEEATKGEEDGGEEPAQKKISLFEKIGEVAKKAGSVAKVAFSGIGKAVNGIAGFAKRAVNGVRSVFSRTESGANGALGVVRKLSGTLIGVGSAYSIISRAVNAFMAENQKLSASLNSAWTALGNVLGPIITQIINWITAAISYFLEFLRLLGVTNKSASELSKKTKGAGAEMKKTLAGFDELNLLNGPGGGGGPNGQLENKEVPDWIKDIADFLKKGEWEKGARVLAQKMNELVSGVDWNEIGKKIGYYLGGALKFIATIIKEFDWKNLGASLAEGVNGILESVDWADLGTILSAKFRVLLMTIGGFLETLDWASLAQSFNDFAISFLNGITDAIAAVDWQSIGENVATFLGGVDWGGIADALFSGIGAAIGGLAAFLWGLIKNAWNSVVEWWYDVAYEDGEFTMQGLLNGIWNKIKDIGSWIKTHIFDPFIEGFKRVFGIASPSTVMEEQGNFIIEGLLEGLKSTFDDVKAWLSGLWDEFYGAISDVVSSAWSWGSDLISNLWNGIQSGLGGFWDGISGIATGIWEWLHFSEPEKGPLADFHTWGPDMMKLFASGIEQNKSKVLGAVGDVADGISDAMDGGDFGLNNINVSGIDNVMDGFADKIVGGFETMIERLQAIADNVMFTMPAVAGGGIVPYGVSGGVPGVSSSGGDANTLAAIQALMGLVERFENSVNNMQWVLKFGNERAVVREITRIQKQEERARG